MDLVKLCLLSGALKAEEIPIDKLVLQPELREYCKQNSCGCYAQNYKCPPAVGEIDELINKLMSYDSVVIWQSVYPLEDSFDFEGMMKAQTKHNAMTMEIAEQAYSQLGRENILILTAGSCTLCKSCAYIDSLPCRFPDKALSSLEAYGVNVSSLSEVTDMKYINGTNTVTYFSGLFQRSCKTPLSKPSARAIALGPSAKS